MVEFAIVAPLLFVLLFGIIEFGVMLYDQAVITNASREGARYASTYYIDPKTSDGTGNLRSCADVQDFVQNYVYHRIISLAATPGPIEGCCGGTLTNNHTVAPCNPSATWPAAGLDQPQGNAGLVQGVTVSYKYSFLVFGNLIQLLGGSVSPTWDLTATSVMRDEDQSPGS